MVVPHRPLFCWEVQATNKHASLLCRTLHDKKVFSSGPDLSCLPNIFFSQKRWTYFVDLTALPLSLIAIANTLPLLFLFLSLYLSLLLSLFLILPSLSTFSLYIFHSFSLYLFFSFSLSPLSPSLSPSLPLSHRLFDNGHFIIIGRKKGEEGRPLYLLFMWSIKGCWTRPSLSLSLSLSVQ